MTNHVLLTILFSMISMVTSIEPGERPEERQIISYGKGIKVSRLDSKLPRERFDRWLQRIAGPKAKLNWEANDCGEQTGEGRAGARGSVPTCVQVEARLTSSVRVVVMIVVGSVQTGITKKPTLKDAFIERNGDFRTIARLSDLSEIIRHEQNR